MHRKQIWPLHGDVKGQHTLIIWINLIGLKTPRLCMKFRGSEVFGSGEYMGMASTLVNWLKQFKQIFVPLIPRNQTWNMITFSQSVSEEKSFECWCGRTKDNIQWTVSVLYALWLRLITGGRWMTYNGLYPSYMLSGSGWWQVDNARQTMDRVYLICSLTQGTSKLFEKRDRIRESCADRVLVWSLIWKNSWGRKSNKTWAYQPHQCGSRWKSKCSSITLLLNSVSLLQFFYPKSYSI